MMKGAPNVARGIIAFSLTMTVAQNSEAERRVPSSALRAATKSWTLKANP